MYISLQNWPKIFSILINQSISFFLSSNTQAIWLDQLKACWLGNSSRSISSYFRFAVNVRNGDGQPKYCIIAIEPDIIVLSSNHHQ